jgi:hypothetical protein
MEVIRGNYDNPNDCNKKNPQFMRVWQVSYYQTLCPIFSRTYVFFVIFEGLLTL